MCASDTKNMNSSLACMCLKFTTMILVKIVVGGDDGAIRKFAAGERRLRFLAFAWRRELDKNLADAAHFNVDGRPRYFQRDHVAVFCALAAHIVENICKMCRGLLSQEINKQICVPSYSSSSRKSSSVTMLRRHKTFVAGPAPLLKSMPAVGGGADEYCVLRLFAQLS